MKLFKTFIKIFKNALSSGELFVLVFSLIIATASITTITLFNSRIDNSLVQSTAKSLGADIVIVSGQALPNKVMVRAKELNLKFAKKTNFLSMVVKGKQLTLASVMAATKSYPLRGDIKLKNARHGSIMKGHVPSRGKASIEPRMLSQLKLKLGQTITIGNASFIANSILAELPSPTMSLVNFAPRILINAADLPKTQVIQPGSHVHYEWFFTGKPTDIKLFTQTLKQTLDRQYRFIDTNSPSGNTAELLKTASRYMKLAALISIVFAGIAIMMSTSWFFRRQQTLIALLRTFGTPYKTIRTLYFLLLSMVAIISIFFGLIIGQLMQGFLVDIIFGTFDQRMPSADYSSLWLSIITGILLLIGFSLPNILLIHSIKPILLFRHDLPTLNTNKLLFYLSASICIIALLILYTKDIMFAIFIIGLMALGTAFFWLVGYIVFHFAREIAHATKRSLKLALISFTREKGAVRAQLLAFSLVITMIIFVSVLQQDIVRSWIKKIPKNTPNTFLLNIAPNQVQAFMKTTKSLELKLSPLYPVVRARLVALNDQPILKAIPNSAKNNNALYRDLNLSWTSTLPEGNKIIVGSWFSPKNVSTAIETSVEAGVAKSLGLKLGDRLTLKNGPQLIHATITSIRSVNWNTLTPNFFLLFSANALKAYPHTFMTSLYLDGANQEALSKIISQFPNISVFDISAILNQVQHLLTKLNQAILILLIFVLLSGLAILASASQRAFYENKQQLALLRTFGASKRILLLSTLGQYLILGLVSGLIGTVCANIGASIVAQVLFKITYHGSLLTFIGGPIFGMIIITLFGLMLNIKLFNIPPTILLRRLN